MFTEIDNTFNIWSIQPKTENNRKFTTHLMIVSMGLAFTVFHLPRHSCVLTKFISV